MQRIRWRILLWHIEVSLEGKALKNEVFSRFQANCNFFIYNNFKNSNRPWKKIKGSKADVLKYPIMYLHG